MKKTTEITNKTIGLQKEELHEVQGGATMPVDTMGVNGIMADLKDNITVNPDNGTPTNGPTMVDDGNMDPRSHTM